MTGASPRTSHPGLGQPPATGSPALSPGFDTRAAWSAAANVQLPVEFLIKLFLFDIEGRHPILLDLLCTGTWREMRRPRLQVTDRRLRYRCARLAVLRSRRINTRQCGCCDHDHGKQS